MGLFLRNVNGNVRVAGAWARNGSGRFTYYVWRQMAGGLCIEALKYKGGAAKLMKVAGLRVVGGAARWQEHRARAIRPGEARRRHSS